ISTGRNQPAELTLAERYAVACRSKTESRRQRKDLPHTLELAKGMKVLVTENLQTDLDLTNGSRGEIMNIILHEDEPPISGDGVVYLKYLPAYVLVKMGRTRASKLAGLEEGVIPIEPAKTTMQIKVSMPGNKFLQRTVHRRQFPITPAYAFTDYRSQGQTLPYVIVDIAAPPTGVFPNGTRPGTSDRGRTIGRVGQEHENMVARDGRGRANGKHTNSSGGERKQRKIAHSKEHGTHEEHVK
ncbi:hypothetical protein PHLCEN_2v13327, partial [Hermanssonia centrifuga]